MSHESLLSVSPSASSAPASAPVSRSSTIHSVGGTGNASAGGGAQTGGQGSSATGTGSQTGNGAEGAAEAGRASGASKHNSGATKRSTGQASHSSKPRGHSHGGTQSGKDFSQTLAQSLATASESRGHSGGQSVHSESKPVNSAATEHGTGKAHKAHTNDAAGTAMTLVTGAAPATASSSGNAHAGAAEHSGASKRSEGGKTVGSVGADTTHGAARNSTHVLMEETAFAQSGATRHPARQDATSGTAHSAANGATALGNLAALSTGQLASGPHSSAAGTAAALSAPVGSKAWTGQLGTQLTWMARQGVQNASLQLSPQHLGPVQVSISVHHGHASVWFGATQSETRQALNQALPELRAMFANQGLALTDSGVSRDAPRGSHQAGTTAVAAVGDPAASEGAPDGTTLSLAGVGLVDTYA